MVLVWPDSVLLQDCTPDELAVHEDDEEDAAKYTRTSVPAGVLAFHDKVAATVDEAPEPTYW